MITITFNDKGWCKLNLCDWLSTLQTVPGKTAGETTEKLHSNLHLKYRRYGKFRYFLGHKSFQS